MNAPDCCCVLRGIHDHSAYSTKRLLHKRQLDEASFHITSTLPVPDRNTNSQRG